MSAGVIMIPAHVTPSGEDEPALEVLTTFNDGASRSSLVTMVDGVDGLYVSAIRSLCGRPAELSSARVSWEDAIDLAMFIMQHAPGEVVLASACGPESREELIDAEAN